MNAETLALVLSNYDNRAEADRLATDAGYADLPDAIRDGHDPVMGWPFDIEDVEPCHDCGRAVAYDDEMDGGPGHYHIGGAVCPLHREHPAARDARNPAWTHDHRTQTTTSHERTAREAAATVKELDDLCRESDAPIPVEIVRAVINDLRALTHPDAEPYTEAERTV